LVTNEPGGGQFAGETTSVGVVQETTPCPTPTSASSPPHRRRQGLSYHAPATACRELWRRQNGRCL